MHFQEYQNIADGTAIYDTRGTESNYPVMKLCGEAGEVAEKWAKYYYRDGGDFQKFKEEIIKELGDVLWYINAIGFELGIDLEDIAQINLQKLKSRQERGQLKGEGDNR